MIALMDSKNNFEANVKVAQTFEQMNRSVLNILA
jgi:flagellar basal body rod protein FlgC